MSPLAATSSSIGGVGYHDIVRQAAAEKRALADVSAIKSASKLLLHLHGSFMIVAWIGFASLGIVLARYYKQTWVDNSCCGKDVWFFVSLITPKTVITSLNLYFKIFRILHLFFLVA